jgi:hypothetical protein
MAAWSRDGGGPAPAGNGLPPQPIHSCPCGAMYSGGRHTCRTATRDTDREPEAGG